MMSARLLRAEDAASGHATTAAALAAAASTRWHRPRLRVAAPALAMRHRWARGRRLLALAVIASSVPLYGWVKQEYIPTDVDEAEFEVLVDGPEGMSLAAMDEAVQAMDQRDPRGRRASRLVLADRRRQLPGHA